MGFPSSNNSSSENIVRNKQTHFAKVGKFAHELHRSKSNVGVDITMKSTDGGRFVFHSLVAAAHSAFFRRLIQYRRLPFKISSDYSSDAIRQMLQFFYEGDVRPEMEKISELFRLASRWEIKELKKYLEALLCEFALDSAFLPHCMNIAVSMEANVGSTASHRIFKIAAKNLHLLLQDGHLQQLSALAIYKLLSDSDLAVGSELDVARILILYLGDRPDFSKHQHLWSTIHFEKLSEAEAKELFERIKTVRDEKIQKIVLDRLTNRQRITSKSHQRRSNPHLHKFLKLLEGQRSSNFQTFPEHRRSRSLKCPQQNPRNVVNKLNRHASLPLLKSRLLEYRCCSTSRNLEDSLALKSSPVETLRVSRFQRAKPLGGATISNSAHSEGRRSIQNNPNLSLLNGDIRLFDEWSDSASESAKQSSIDSRVVELEQKVPKVVLLSQQQQKAANFPTKSPTQKCINSKMYSPASLHELQLTPDLLRSVGGSDLSDIRALPDPFGCPKSGGGSAIMTLSQLFAKKHLNGEVQKVASQECLNQKLRSAESLYEIEDLPNCFGSEYESGDDSVRTFVENDRNIPNPFESKKVNLSSVNRSGVAPLKTSSPDSSSATFGEPNSKKKTFKLNNFEYYSEPSLVKAAKVSKGDFDDTIMDLNYIPDYFKPLRFGRSPSHQRFNASLIKRRESLENKSPDPFNVSSLSDLEDALVTLSSSNSSAISKNSNSQSSLSSALRYSSSSDDYFAKPLSSRPKKSPLKRTDSEIWEIDNLPLVFVPSKTKNKKSKDVSVEFGQEGDMNDYFKSPKSETCVTVPLNESCYSLSEGGAYAHLRPSRYARTDVSIAQFEDIPDLFLNNSLLSFNNDTTATNESCYSPSQGGAYAHLRPSRYVRTDDSIADFQQIPNNMFVEDDEKTSTASESKDNLSQQKSPQENSLKAFFPSQ